jgi:hypothetical protein
MCDTIEGVRQVDFNGTGNSTAVSNATTLPDSKGVGLEEALRNYAGWFKYEFLRDSKISMMASHHTGKNIRICQINCTQLTS